MRVWLTHRFNISQLSGNFYRIPEAQFSPSLFSRSRSSFCYKHIIPSPLELFIQTGWLIFIPFPSHWLKMISFQASSKTSYTNKVLSCKWCLVRLNYSDFFRQLDDEFNFRHKQDVLQVIPLWILHSETFHQTVLFEDAERIILSQFTTLNTGMGKVLLEYMMSSL